MVNKSYLKNGICLLTFKLHFIVQTVKREQNVKSAAVAHRGQSLTAKLTRIRQKCRIKTSIYENNGWIIK